MEDKRTKDEKEELKKLQKNLSKVRGFVEKLKKKTGSNKKIPISRLPNLYEKNYPDDLFANEAIGNVQFYADLLYAIRQMWWPHHQLLNSWWRVNWVVIDYYSG